MTEEDHGQHEEPSGFIGPHQWRGTGRPHYVALLRGHEASLTIQAAEIFAAEYRGAVADIISALNALADRIEQQEGAKKVVDTQEAVDLREDHNRDQEKTP